MIRKIDPKSEIQIKQYKNRNIRKKQHNNQTSQWCPSLVICAVPTPVKTTPELSGPAFRVLPKISDEELED